MAKREVCKEPTTSRRLTTWFAMVYSHLTTTTTTTTPPPDEENGEVPPSPLPSDTNSVATGNDSTLADTSTPAQPARPNNDLHPVMKMVQEQELGKAVMGFAIPIAMTIVTAGKDKLAKSEMSFLLILLCFGFTAIFNGILLKETFPKKFAQILEPVGISLVAIAFFAIVAFFLPVEISWVPAVCIGLCLMPFAIAVWQPAPA